MLTRRGRTRFAPRQAWGASPSPQRNFRSLVNRRGAELPQERILTHETECDAALA